MNTEDDRLGLRIQELSMETDARRSAEAAERSEEAAQGVFGRLKRLREAVGLTQVELARRVGTSQPAIARLEAGISDPRLSTIQRYSVALGQELELDLHTSIVPMRELVAAWNERDLERWRKALGDELVVSGPGLAEMHGREAAAQLFGALHQEFPNGSVDECWHARIGDRVVLEGVLRGHNGVSRGQAGEEMVPKGKRVDLPFVAIGTVSGEKIQRLAIYGDRGRPVRVHGAVTPSRTAAYA